MDSYSINGIIRMFWPRTARLYGPAELSTKKRFRRHVRPRPRRARRKKLRAAAYRFPLYFLWGKAMFLAIHQPVCYYSSSIFIDSPMQGCHAMHWMKMPGERPLGPPKGLKLSGKRTGTGQSSGESAEADTEEARPRAADLSGQRTEAHCEFYSALFLLSRRKSALGLTERRSRFAGRGGIVWIRKRRCTRSMWR